MSSTHTEYSSPDLYVRIQHCEHTDENNVVCDEYLGVNYPSSFCDKHQTKK